MYIITLMNNISGNGMFLNSKKVIIGKSFIHKQYIYILFLFTFHGYVPFTVLVNIIVKINNVVSLFFIKQILLIKM